MLDWIVLNPIDAGGIVILGAIIYFMLLHELEKRLKRPKGIYNDKI
jgi:hypothetical protein